MQTSRRDLLKVAGAFGALGLVPGRALFGAAVPAGRGKPNLRLGIVGDLHVNCKAETAAFRAALVHFRAANVDGVILTGDMANTGLTDQLEMVGEVWREVLPDDKAADGRKVEKLFIYGNHDTDGYGKEDLARLYPDEKERDRHYLTAHQAESWERVFGEPWKGVWAKTVKGYVIIGAHWGHEKEVGPFLAAEGEKLGLKGRRPFFYVQHPHLKDTVQGPWAWGQDDGSSGDALTHYPNAVAFSGHSHYSLTDERTIWQGYTFTAVGTSSLGYIYAQDRRENGESPVGGEMPLLNERASSQGMLMEVYDDRIVLQRLDFTTGGKLGADWVVPLDGSRPYNREKRAARAIAPEFAEGARVEVSRAMGRNRAGASSDQVTVAFPPALDSKTSRVFDYEVRALVYDEDVDHETCARRVLATDFHLPLTRRAKELQKCVFAASDLPSGRWIRFAVRPIECYGRKGREIFSESWFCQRQ